MTDETRILRTVGIPLVIAIVLLFVLPKMCARAVQVSKTRQEKAARAAGLHIESSHQPVSYPAGLDPERLRYLIEVDNRFAAPFTGRVSKTPSSIAPLEEQQMMALLVKAGYAEVANDGTLTLTREGMLHLDGLVDDGATWTFPVARRQFESVTSIESEGTGARASFAWHWVPASVGSALITSPKRHENKAELSRGAGSWTLTALTVDGDLD
jgi:hypothetical protein